MNFIKLKSTHINPAHIITCFTYRVMDEIEVTVTLTDHRVLSLKNGEAKAFIAYLDGISEQIHFNGLEAVA